MSIKDLPIRIRIKGKTRGRPSKYEIFVSKLLSKVMEMEENKKAIRKAQEDLMVYGYALMPELKLPKDKIPREGR